MIKKYKNRKEIIGFGPKHNRTAYYSEYNRLRKLENPNYRKNRKRYDKYNPDEARINRERIRFRALLIYGSKCQECKNSDERLLQIHHKNGKGEEKSRETYRRIEKSGHQEDLELLCSNCHILANIRDGTIHVSTPIGDKENIIQLDNFLSSK